MVSEPTYSISELAATTGVTARTIRYYSAEGLLPEPEIHGRYARYGSVHVARLAQIAGLKAHYLPLRVIREQLEATTVAPANPDATPALPPTAAYTRRSSITRQLREAGITQNFGYMEHSQEHAKTAVGLQALPLPTPADLTQETTVPLRVGQYQFFPNLPERLAKADSMSASAFWERITLAPGIELHIHEAASAQQREKLAMLLAAAHEILAETT